MSFRSTLTLSILRKLPAKGRRIILLTTLYMKLNDISPEELKQSIAQLNAKMHLVKKEEALAWPCSLYNLIWEGVEVPIRGLAKPRGGESVTIDELILTDQDIMYISKRIAENSSLVLKRDNVDQYAKEIEEVFRYTLNDNNGHLPLLDHLLEAK